jgi:hypothetical protein
MIAVVKVIPLKDSLLQISLSDGREGIFNIMPYCASDYFNPKKAIGILRNI